MNRVLYPGTSPETVSISKTLLVFGGAGLFLWLLMIIVVPVARAQTGTAAGTVGGSIQGVVTSVDPQGLPRPVIGIPVKLSPAEGGGSSVSSITTEEGRYRFEGLTPGLYKLEASAAGFEPVLQTVDLTKGGNTVQDLSLRLSSVVESVEVRDDANPISTQSSSTTSTVTETQINTLPIAEQKFDAALPLVPGVIRTWEGELNIKGVPENQGMLLVDAAETVDPVTGSFSIPIPLDAIRSISVSKTPYSAEYGGFSGGLVIIQTKAPLDRWRFGLEDFLPSFRGKNGVLVGLADIKPRIHFSGPLAGKLGFSEAFSFEFERRPVRGLPWPFNEIKTRGFDSLTGFQITLTPRHLLNATVNGFSFRRQFANINTLVPQSASSDSNQHGLSLGATDTYEFASGMILNTVFRYGRFYGDGRGQGFADMSINPEGWGGNFFNRFTRTSDQYQLLSTIGLPVKEWHGSHALKLGVDFTRRSYGGVSQSHPIQLLREDGSIAARIDFQGIGNVHGLDAEVAEFIQDQWTINNHLTADLGGRLVSQSAGRAAAFAPRVGLAFTPDANRKTLLRAGAGIFYDRVPLLATGFKDNPTRVVTYFDANSQPIGAPIVFQNVYLRPDAGNIADRWDGSSRNFTWNVEVDHDLGRGLTIRASFLSSQTHDLPIVTPVTGATGEPSYLGLANSGKSRYSEFEATLHYRSERHELNVSYIHSRSRGDLNAISTTYVPFEQPVIRPNLSGILPSDIPHRMVAWGTFSLPLKLTFSPIVDVHSGVPFYTVDELQNYVGVPNTVRLPYFFSLDVKMFREIPLSWLPFKGVKTHKLRVGAYSLNVTSHKNPHDIYNNIASPLFGRIAGIQRRGSGFVLELVN